MPGMLANELSKRVARLKIKRYINCASRLGKETKLKKLCRYYQDYRKVFSFSRTIALILIDVGSYLRGQAEKRLNKIIRSRCEGQAEVAVVMEGGIGDTVVGARFIRDSWSFFKIEEKFDVYSKHRSATRDIYCNLNKFNRSERIEELNPRKYKCVINVGQYVVITCKDNKTQISNGLGVLIKNIENKYKVQ